MLNQGPITKKILLTLDLDMTLFNSRDRNSVRWLGGDEQFWLDTFDSVKAIAKEQGVEIIFSIVTSKTHFDDMCSVVATSLRKYLERSNDQLYVTYQNKLYCLVYDNGQYKYESLTDSSSFKAAPKFTPFVIQQNANKTEFIKSQARFHGIPLQQCIFLDDDASNIYPAKAEGINVVSYLWSNFLLNEQDIKAHLEKSKERLLFKVRDIVLDMQLDETLATVLFTPFYNNREQRSRLLDYVPGTVLDDSEVVNGGEQVFSRSMFRQ